MKKLRLLLVLAGSLLFAQYAAAGPVLVNGSLTGPIANAGLPPGWTVVSPSPDTMDENNNVGCCGSFQATPSASPDGGTWIGFADDGGGFLEQFGQSVSGFDIGTSYDVSWYQANFGYSSYTNAGRDRLVCRWDTAGPLFSFCTGAKLDAGNCFVYRNLSNSPIVIRARRHGWPVLHVD